MYLPPKEQRRTARSGGFGFFSLYKRQKEYSFLFSVVPLLVCFFQIALKSWFYNDRKIIVRRVGRRKRENEEWKGKKQLKRRKRLGQEEKDRQIRDWKEKWGKRRGDILSHLNNNTKWRLKRSRALQESWKGLRGRRSSSVGWERESDKMEWVQSWPSSKQEGEQREEGPRCGLALCPPWWHWKSRSVSEPAGRWTVSQERAVGSEDAAWEDDLSTGLGNGALPRCNGKNESRFWTALPYGPFRKDGNVIYLWSPIWRLISMMSNTVVAHHLWLLSPWNVDNMTKELNFEFYFVLIDLN